MSSSNPAVLHDEGIALFRAGRFREARALFLRATQARPDDWSAWYWAGQCERFDEEFAAAREHLEMARRLAPEEKHVLLALGIVLQQMERLPEAIAVFASAIELDEDFAPAFNSLAVTQRKMGELEKALHNYDAGTKALARSFVRTIPNSVASPIVPFEEIPGTRWIDCAMFGALFSAASSPWTERVAFPTGDFAEREEQTREHGGLFWVDSADVRDRYRLFLPNYFHFFREYLRAGNLFHYLIGNQAVIHESRGELDVARELYSEAAVFGDPRASSFRLE